MSTPIEIERKLLIRMPALDLLKEQEGLRIKKIEQTYLLTSDSTTARVRKITEDGRVSFVKTVKKRISMLSQYEDEHEITAAQYAEELKSADTTRKTVEKTRYCFPFENHIIEIDVFPFWSDRAILEVELSDESEYFSLPAFVEIIKEVSDDRRYKNTNLAIDIPMDEI